MRFVRPHFLLAGLLLAGCASVEEKLQPQAAALDKYPGLEQKVVEYYDNSNTVEKDYDCTNPNMTAVTRAKVLSETPTQVKMAIGYDFDSGSMSSKQGGNLCQGFDSRVFTFNKTSTGGLTVDSMSGNAP
jgi:hypothetical protein